MSLYTVKYAWRLKMIPLSGGASIVPVGHCREYLPQVTQFKRLSSLAIQLSKWKKFQLFDNNGTGGKKLLEESVNSIGQFLKVIGHYAYWIFMN